MSALDRYALRREVREAAVRLAQAGVASPEVDARLLAEHLLGCALLLADGAEEGFSQAYHGLVERRAAREPLQHVTGRMWFRSLELASRPGVFIVRPETEVVAEAAVREAQRVSGPDRVRGSGAPVVVDLCTGSGAVAVAVAVEAPWARVVGVEIDAGAAALAAENCERLAPGRVEVITADATDARVLAERDGGVDVVVSNPPYVPEGGTEDVETSEHDPALALYGGGPEGLLVPVAIIVRSRALLRPGGLLVMEHDAGQGRALREEASRAGLVDVSTGQDLTGRDRYLLARAPRSGCGC